MPFSGPLRKGRVYYKLVYMVRKRLGLTPVVQMWVYDGRQRTDCHGSPQYLFTRVLFTNQQTLKRVSSERMAIRSLPEVKARMSDWTDCSIQIASRTMDDSPGDNGLWLRDPSMDDLPSPCFLAGEKLSSNSFVGVNHLRVVDPALESDLDALRSAVDLQLIEVRVEKTCVSCKWISVLAALPRLRAISLSGSNLSWNGFEWIAQVRGLRWLDLSFLQVPAWCLEVISRIQSLESLVIAGTTMPGEGAAFLRRCESLKSLHMPYCRIDRPLAEYIPQSKRLARLDLAGMRCDKKTAFRLQELSSLRDLNILGANISEGFVENVSKVCKLERLWLPVMCLNERIIRALADVPSLRWISIGPSSSAVASHVHELKARLPKCHIRVVG